MAAKAAAHGLQLAEPAHVALAPRRHAVAQPVLLAHDLASELVLLALFLFEDRVAPFLEMREPLVQPPRPAAVEPDGGAADPLQETPVVRDHDERGGRADEFVFQPLDHGKVEMVGRLVEQQDVGFRRHDAGKCGAPRLAAGQFFGLFLAGQPEMFHEIGRTVRIVGGTEARLDIGADGGEAVHVRHLRQIADGCGRLAEDLAVLRLDLAGGDLQQRRFSRTVAADQRDAVAGRRRQFGAVEQRRAAERQHDAVERQKWRSH